jgi:hypothetical protein
MENAELTQVNKLKNVRLRLQRIFEIETNFKPEVRILLADALWFAVDENEGGI